MSSEVAAGRARRAGTQRANASKTERRGVSAARLAECKLYKVVSIYQLVGFCFCFAITVCVKKLDEGVACRHQSASKRNASAAALTTDSRQWLVTTLETGFKVVRAQQPPLTKETLPPHLSSLEHPPTYRLLLTVER